MKRRHNQPPGFSLIEAAIVLGIVGLVIGGIWVAASAVQKQRLVSNVLEALSTGHETAQALYKTTSSGSQTYIGDLLPGRPLAGGFAYNSGTALYYNGQQSLFMMIDRASASSAPYFVVEIMMRTDSGGSNWRAQADLCIALSSRLLATDLGRAPDDPSFGSLTWLDTSGNVITNWDTGAAKPTMSQIGTRCGTTGDLVVFWAL